MQLSHITLIYILMCFFIFSRNNLKECSDRISKQYRYSLEAVRALPLEEVSIATETFPSLSDLVEWLNDIDVNMYQQYPFYLLLFLTTKMISVIVGLFQIYLIHFFIGNTMTNFIEDVKKKASIKHLTSIMLTHKKHIP